MLGHSSLGWEPNPPSSMCPSAPSHQSQPSWLLGVPWRVFFLWKCSSCFCAHQNTAVWEQEKENYQEEENEN